MTDQIQSTRLDNGLTVLTEHMPGLRSCTVGIWARRGSRHEQAELNGICHFIEHAVFKGTRRRTALDIAVASDRLGGQFDAYTSHELTGFALKVVDTAVALAESAFAGNGTTAAPDPDGDTSAPVAAAPIFTEGKQELEQAHLILATP